MPFVDRFLSNLAIHNDVAKSNRFEVLIFLNNNLLNVIGRGHDLRFQCEAAEIPGYNLDTVDGVVYGAPYAIAARPNFTDLNLTFICAGDMWEKKFFDGWQDFILPKRDYLARYRNEYVGDIDVIQYHDRIDPVYGNAPRRLPDGRMNYNMGPETIYRARYIEAFPTSVNPINVNWGDDNINRLSVTFKYRKWEYIDRRVGE